MDVDVGPSPHPRPATAGTATATGNPHDQQVATSIGRRRLGLLLGPAVLAAVLVSPLPLTRSQHDLVAVLAFTMTYWVTEALPIPATSLLALALCVLLDVPRATGQDASPGAVVFAGFSSPTMFLFIGGFILAQAMIKHGLNRRLALAVLALPRVARSSYRVVVAFGLLGAALSSMIANGAVATMLLPIAIGIDRSLAELMRHQVPGLAQRTRLRFSTGLMLMTAYGITVGGLMTPIGDPSNLIGRSFIAGELKTRISFVRWVELAAPVVIVLFVVLSVVLLVLNRPEVGRFEGARRLIQRQRGQLGPMSRGERNVLLAFLAALALWVPPTVVGLIAGSDSAVHRMLEARVDEAVAAIMAATLLFVVPVD